MLLTAADVQPCSAIRQFVVRPRPVQSQTCLQRAHGIAQQDHDRQLHDALVKCDCWLRARADDAIHAPVFWNK